MLTSDEKRFLDWWSPAERAIAYFARRLSGSTDFVDDIVQDMALATWAQRELFATPEDLLKWAVKRGRWLALERRRSQWRRSALLQRYATEPLSAPVKAPPPFEDEIQDLRDVVGRLPDRQKQVIEALFDGKSDSQIASEMGIARATARSLRRHAMWRLANLYGVSKP